jgi:hypothetical protein
MPVRKIPKNFTHITGIVASSKAIGEAGFEGRLEYEHLLLLAFAPWVATFEVQPVRIPWRDQNGKEHWYTIDIRVNDIDENVKPLLGEVKPRAILKEDWAELKPKFRAAIRYANQGQCRFKLITDREIRTQYLTNVRFLLPFVRRGADSEMQQTVMEALRKGTESTPRRLMNDLASDLWKQAEYLPALWYLIGTFQVCADLDQPLTMDVRVCLP